jgi:acetoin utilization protein AcuB
MNVAEIMQGNLQTVRPEATIAEAITTLVDAHVMGLPVIDRDGQLIGVLSTSDVLQALAESAGAEEREEVFDTMAKELMTRDPKTISSTADVRDAAQQMLYLEVHRLFVVDNGKLVGVVSQSDVVRTVATSGADTVRAASP